MRRLYHSWMGATLMVQCVYVISPGNTGLKQMHGIIIESLFLQKMTHIEAAIDRTGFLTGTNQACKNYMSGNVVCGRNRSNA